jgi:hypothetical protein
MAQLIWRNSFVLVASCPFIFSTALFAPEAIAQTTPTNSNTPPSAVLGKFFKYLNSAYSLYLGDDRSACSYSVDPSGIRAEGSDRFFLAKLSRGKQGTACRGVVAFQIMQADCKDNKLYRFAREENADMRLAGWERYEAILYDPDNKGLKPQSQKMLKTICK